MDIERFKNSSTGRMVRRLHEGREYWAFVPNPLPPTLEADFELMHVLSDADRALGELKGLGRNIPNPHLLIGPFMRREAVLSSRIEGTQAGIADLYAYEAQQSAAGRPESSVREADVKEVSNYVRALEYGVYRVDELPLSLRLIRELHEHLMEGVRGEEYTPGEFRRIQNWLAAPDPQTAPYVPPPVDDMTTALGSFEQYLHASNGYPPLVRIALVHYQFEAIHPFVDGNGRIGRLLISLLLACWNLLPLPLLYLSAYFEKNRTAYYDLLLGISEKGAWREWLLFFLRGVTEQALDANGRANRLQDLKTEFHRKLTQTRSSALLLRLADSLFEMPVLTIPDAQRLLGVSYPSAQQSINKLVAASVLDRLGKASYGKTYVAEDILEIIGGNETAT